MNGSKPLIFAAFAASLIFLSGCGMKDLTALYNKYEMNLGPTRHVQEADNKSKPLVDKHAEAAQAPSVKTEADQKAAAKPEKPVAVLNWDSPSGGKYPQLAKDENIWLDVSVGDQKVYVKDGSQTLYTMIMSSGLDTDPGNSTPKGTFHIEPERGKWFYSGQYKEGAEYWVSWKNHGEFLFHSVPMDQKQNVIQDEAKKLGQKASHGCIRLTVADAEWIYNHIPANTKVVIRD